MRRNPRLPKSSVIEDNAEKIADAIVEYLKSASRSSSSRKNRVIGDLFSSKDTFFVASGVPYTSSSGVSGEVSVYISFEDGCDSATVGGACHVHSRLPSVEVKVSRAMSLATIYTKKFHDNVFYALVHELGHMVDKSTRYSGTVSASDGLIKYISSRKEVQADAQAAFSMIKRKADALGVYVPAKMLEDVILGDLPEDLSNRYYHMEERSKRIFLLYVYNALNEEGLLS